eukprot:1913149-Pyramimonas_sp.AAC.1
MTDTILNGARSSLVQDVMQGRAFAVLGDLLDTYSSHQRWGNETLKGVVRTPVRSGTILHIATTWTLWPLDGCAFQQHGRLLMARELGGVPADLLARRICASWGP